MLGTIIISGMAVCSALGAVKMIFDSCLAQSQRWQESQLSVRNQMDRVARDINRSFAQTQESLRFQALNEHYFQSRKLADKAYALLCDANDCREALYKSISLMKSEIHRVKDARFKCSDSQERNRLKLELDALYSNENEFSLQLESLIRQIGEYSSKLREFNSRTREIKLTMRDSCGEGGRIWYERLAGRIEASKEMKQLR